MNRTRRTMLVVALLSGLFAVGCGSIPDPWKDKSGPPHVLVTFPPIASWVKAVGGEQAGVIFLCTSTGPHDYQFDNGDVYKLKKADLFLANGLGLDDSFADKLNSNSGNPNLRYRKLADSLPKDVRKPNDKYVPGEKHQHDEEGGCCGGHGPFDPHAWLGLNQAIAMVGQVRDDLKAASPAGAAGFDTRAADYIKELKTQLADGKERLGKLKAPIITNHESMGYFADTFGLKVIGSIRGLDGQEGDSQKLAGLVRACKGHERVLIAVEPQYRRNSADILKKELAKAKNGKCEAIVVILNPLETCDPDEELTASWYLDGMRNNIDALAKTREMTTSLLTLRNVGVELGGRPILDGVTADVERGRITAIIGLNGSGKTTLLRCILRELPFQGTIKFHCGHDHSRPDPQHVGYVPQKLRIEARLPLTVCDLLGLSLMKRPLFLGVSRALRERMVQMLKRVWLEADILDRPVEKISGGELQRVLLTLALEPSPELLLLDEPAAGIDFQKSGDFYGLLAQLNSESGVTIVLASHDLTIVNQHAHHVLCLRDGRIQCQGAPAEILTPEVIGQTFGSNAGLFDHHH